MLFFHSFCKRFKYDMIYNFDRSNDGSVCIFTSLSPYREAM